MANTDVDDFVEQLRRLEDAYDEAVSRLEEAEKRGDTEGAARLERLRRQIFEAQDRVVIEGWRGTAQKLLVFRRELELAAQRARSWPFPSNPDRRSTQSVGPSSEPGGEGDVSSSPPVPNMDTPNPPPAGQPTTFIRARLLAPKTVVYIDAQGREILREAGSRSWRNNNPGNIRKGNFANMAGAIGDDGAFAIFPASAIGFDAIVSLLRSNSYNNLSLRDAVFRYAPPNENDSAQYATFLTQETGIQGNAILSSLGINDIRKIAKIIQKIEGWHEGVERANTPNSSAVSNAPLSSAAGAAGDWMSIAQREAALPERERSQWTDPGENPRIAEYFRVASSWFDPVGGDEVDWCAAFVNFCLVKSGYIGTDHPGARSFFWNKKNQFVKLVQPRYGAIAVRRYAPFIDVTWATGEGHVGFVHSWTSTTVELLGGNQGETVRLQTFPLVTKNSKGTITAQFVAFLMPVMN